MAETLPPAARADLDNARRALALNNSSVHLVPRITTQEANAAHVAALEAEIARLRAGIEALRIAHGGGPDCATEYCGGACNCGADEHNARIDVLLRGESCTG